MLKRIFHRKSLLIWVFRAVIVIIKKFVFKMGHKLARAGHHPRKVALGFTIGMWVATTPFIGFHVISATFISWLLRASVFSAIVGTLLIGNPWDILLICVGTYNVGRWVLPDEWFIGAFTYKDLLKSIQKMSESQGALFVNFDFSAFLSHFYDLITPMMVGSTLISLVLAPFVYTLIYSVVKRAQRFSENLKVAEEKFEKQLDKK